MAPRKEKSEKPRVEQGKQLVYHAIQDPKDSVTQEDLATMDKEIQTLRDQIATIKSNEKLLKADLLTINATLSIDDIRANLRALEYEKKEFLGRLEKLRCGDVEPVRPAEKEAIEKPLAEWSKRAASRKQICMELWAIALDCLPEGQSKEELWVIDTFSQFRTLAYRIIAGRSRLGRR
ncbi:MAG: hypothetical protein Q9167_001705 [Letrouitia subvulpina]